MDMDLWNFLPPLTQFLYTREHLVYLFLFFIFKFLAKKENEVKRIECKKNCFFIHSYHNKKYKIEPQARKI